jgi:opacity protein-like surface antigen
MSDSTRDRNIASALMRKRVMCVVVALCVCLSSVGATGCANTVRNTADGMGNGAIAGLYVFGNSPGHYDGFDEFIAVGLGCAAIGGIVGGVFGFVSGFLMDIADFFAWLAGAEPEPTVEVAY